MGRQPTFDVRYVIENWDVIYQQQQIYRQNYYIGTKGQMGIVETSESVAIGSASKSLIQAIEVIQVRPQLELD